MTVPPENAQQTKTSSLLPPTYTSVFSNAATASKYPIIPSSLESSVLLEPKALLSNNASGPANTADTTKDSLKEHILFEYPPSVKPYRPSINSLIASAFSVSFGFPLDSVKTRLQTYKYSGNWHCIVDTYKNEGIMGFYRGLTAPLISSSLMRSWSMSIFTYSKPYTHAFWSSFYDPPDILSYDREAVRQRKLEADSNPAEKESWASTGSYIVRQFPVSFSSGLVAGFSTSFIASPFELTKLGSQIELVIRRRALDLEMTRVSGQSTAPTIVAASKVLPKNATVSSDTFKPLGTFQIAKKLVQKRGWMGLYAGYRYNIVRDGIGSSLYFGVYDSIKSAVSLALFNTPESHPVAVAIAGGLSGAVSWVIIYPLDTIKSRYQRDVMAYVLAQPTPGEDGAVASKLQYPKHPHINLSKLFHRNMYRGLSISLIRTSLLGMAMFSCYEKLMDVTA